MNMEIVAKDVGASRRIIPANKVKAEDLGFLKHLPGTWANIHPEQRKDNDPFKGPESIFNGRGWNFIALPFAQAGQSRNYRVLMNQYNEMLVFKSVDDKVPNRGIRIDGIVGNADQEIVALDYEQTIAQIAAEDIAKSRKAGGPGLPIHHEPGLFLQMREQNINGFNIARLATIPHGNVLTALGRAREIDGKPTIPNLSAFPEGVNDNIADAVARSAAPTSYLFPYQAFTKKPFIGTVKDLKFPGFSPENANALLQLGINSLPGEVVKTTELPMATDVMEAGIVNIPFIERQADAATMRSTFWIMEMDDDSECKHRTPKLVLAYSQFIFLDFFDRVDGRPGRIRWPHISINMMEKISE